MLHSLFDILAFDWSQIGWLFILGGYPPIAVPAANFAAGTDYAIPSCHYALSGIRDSVC